MRNALNAYNKYASRLFGMVIYLSRFVLKLADAIKSISKLTHKITDWLLAEDYIKSFDKIGLIDKSTYAIQNSPYAHHVTVTSLDQISLCFKVENSIFATTHWHRPNRDAQIGKVMLVSVLTLENLNDSKFRLTTNMHTNRQPLLPLWKSPCMLLHAVFNLWWLGYRNIIWMSNLCKVNTWCSLIHQYQEL